MKKVIKYIVLILAIVITTTGCGNKDIWDSNYTYDIAICKIGEEYKEIQIEQWKDYEGEQIQIIGKDKKIYLVSSNNCTLINK